MAEVKNEVFEEKGIADNYVGLFLRVLKNAHVKGLTIGEMTEMQGLIKTLSEAQKAKTVKLTASEIAKIRDRANSFPWAIYSDELVEMDKYLKSLI